MPVPDVCCTVRLSGYRVTVLPSRMRGAPFQLLLQLFCGLLLLPFQQVRDYVHIVLPCVTGVRVKGIDNIVDNIVDNIPQ